MAEKNLSSLRALDALNFCNAGIQTGLGPFIAIYYTAVRHWNPGQIGILIACQSITGIIAQSFVGNWVDESHHKRLITAFAASIVAAGALGIVLIPSFVWQVVVQLIIGLAVTVFPAATAAFALGMVGEDELTKRVSRNESFTHSGNVIFAIAAGAVGTLLALQGIFFAAALFAAGMAPAAMLIRSDHVHYEAARGGAMKGAENQAPKRKTFKEILGDKRVPIFTVAVVLFYFANASTLPLVGEILSAGKHGRQSAWQVAASVVVAELVMIGVAIIAGKLADQWGRKPLFMIGFVTLAIRNALTVVSHNQYYLISLQALDGVAMGLYGVLLTLVTADLAKGTGRFNLVQGAVQTAMGIGGVLSNSLFGFIAKQMGFDASFWGLSIVAVVGGAIYQIAMPETKAMANEQNDDAPQPASH